MANAGLPLMIKFLRKVLLGCTIRKLSVRSGVHENLLSRYEQGDVLPSPRNLDRILATAGLQKIGEPLLLAFERLANLASPPPPPSSQPDLRDLLHQLQSDARLSSGEYSRPTRRDLVSSALLVRFLRTVLLDCSQAELARRTGIDRRTLVRYETGESQRLSPEILDRLLIEAEVLHLKEPLLQAMSHLSDLLMDPSGVSQGLDLPTHEVEAFLASATELLNRTSRTLYPKRVPRQRDVLLDE